MKERVIGLTLIGVGIGIIIFAAFSVLRVFTAKAQPASLFNFPAISLDASSLIGSDAPPDAREALRSGAQAPKLELIPSEIMNKTTNALAHLLLMGFIASIGYKIGSLGVMLSRPIIVNLKSKESETQSVDSSSKN